jgi:ADP-heptose:LPS heptosyltransferase
MNWGAGKRPGLFDLGERPKILISRTDRIGDVVLSLPVARSLKTAFPTAEIHFLVREETAPVAAQAPGVDKLLIYHPDGAGKAKLERDLAEARFAAVICLFPRPELAAAFFRAGISARVGTARRWYSFRFTNRVNISRRTSGRHEKDLNLDLLQPLGIKPDYTMVPELATSSSEDSSAGLLPERMNDGKPLVVIHPGDGGSAMNWPLERYAALAGELSTAGFNIVVTGPAAERERRLREFGGILGKESVLSGRTSLTQLISLLAHADLFVGGSTGPLHLAAALGIKVVAFYGPIHTTTPDRWGPCGKGHVVLTPGVPVCHCKVGRCKLGNCMERIELTHVMQTCLNILDPRATHLSACPPNKKHPASDLTPEGGICR